MVCAPFSPIFSLVYLRGSLMLIHLLIASLDYRISFSKITRDYITDSKDFLLELHYELPPEQCNVTITKLL